MLKPGVEDVLATDLNFLYVTSRVLELINPGLARTSLTGIISDIRQACPSVSSRLSQRNLMLGNSPRLAQTSLTGLY